MKLKRLQALGKLINGKLVLNNPVLFRTILLKYDDGDVRVIVEPKQKTRSHQQNNYYHGVVLQHISQATGHSLEELHEIFKSKYLKTKMLWRGANITTLRSTTELTTNEFAEYLQNVILEANELGITIPEADQTYDL